MATPSSSATTPSPQLHFLQAATVVPPQTMSTGGDKLSIDEERQRAIQKFMARAELSKLTRGLRARLSYATYKATHNLARNTLNDLEEQTEKRLALARAAAIVKPVVSYYGNPATQAGSVTGSSTTSTARNTSKRGSMAPPPTVTASATRSLYTSILAPPPAKRARTIHNPQDPPVPVPPKPTAPAPARKSGRQTRATQSKQRARKDEKTRKDDKGKGRSAEDRTSTRRLASRNSLKNSANNDVDMKAAATLTSLLLSRPSLAASSPRSSISAGSDSGSLHSFPQFAQSSTRTTTTATVAGSPAGARSNTPPPTSRRTQSLTQPSDLRFHSHSHSLPSIRMTPKSQSQPIIAAGGRPAADTNSPHNPPTDSEAADLMLFLATSPSPVRPNTAKERDARDLAAFRSLSGGAALQGRVLFSGSGGMDGASQPHSYYNRGKPLQRGLGSFSSTLSIATDASGETIYAGGIGEEKLIGIPINSTSSMTAVSPFKAPSASRSRQATLDASQLSTAKGSLAEQFSAPGISLDVAPQRSPRTFGRPTNSDEAGNQISSSSLHAGQGQSFVFPTTSSGAMSTPQRPGSLSTQSNPTAISTPSSVPFNLHDFINVTPSPAAPTPQKTGGSSSLRTDVGRRLFEEHHAGGQLHNQGQGGTGAGLGAGIDLVKS